MKEELPANHFRLAFDPFKVKGEDGRMTRRIMCHEQARAIFLFVKTRYLVSQYFHEDCLRLGREIARRIPANVDELRGVMAGAKDPSLREAFRDSPYYGEFSEEPFVAAAQEALLKEPLFVLLEVLQRRKSIIIEIMP